jgi:uncharacterized protein YkwD
VTSVTSTARATRTLAAGVVAALVTTSLMTGGGNAQAASTGAGGGTVVAETSISNNTFERRVLRQINKRRAARDLRRVKIVSDCLDGYAEDWAETIARTGLLIHRDQAIIVAGCELVWAGEALARGTGLTPKGTVKAWMNSPDHKAVIMKRRANRAGIGVRKDAEGRTVVVLNFGDK